MSQQSIDGLLLKEMIIAGANLLEQNREAIDALNVFPVPDGDTGTNMSLTMKSTVKEIAAVDEHSASKLLSMAARGALKGARGNSGVILSQILRGFARGIDGAETIDAETFAKGLESGAKTAYKAVMKPKEGTILTVIRVIAEDSRPLCGQASGRPAQAAGQGYSQRRSHFGEDAGHAPGAQAGRRGRFWRTGSVDRAQGLARGL